jgi:translation initiation factor 2B subunit (eIF-2B alpha/beta/delta family)
LSASKYFRDLGRRQVSVEFSRAALEKKLPDELRLEAMERLAALYKSDGLYWQAVTLWEAVLANSSDAREETRENLAIHYEHREKNLPRALELTQVVLSQLERENRGPSRIEKWAHRQQRLMKKIQKM